MAKITTGELYNEWQSINDKLDKLNEKVDSVIDDGAIETRLTGSNVEDVIFDQYIFNGENSPYKYAFPPSDVRGAIVSVVIHGATGDYSEGKGFRPRLLNYPLGNRDANNTIQITTDYTKRDYGVYQFYIYPSIIDLQDGALRNSGNFFYTSRTAVPNFFAIFLDLDGDLDDGEGYDISGHVMWLR